MGNPCTRWPGYRPYVIGTLPRLKRLDGDPVGAAPSGSSGTGPMACVQHALAGVCIGWPLVAACRRPGTSKPHFSYTPRPQVLPSERIAAAQQLAALEAQLRAELRAEGVDPDAACEVGGRAGGWI